MSNGRHRLTGLVSRDCAVDVLALLRSVCVARVIFSEDVALLQASYSSVHRRSVLHIASVPAAVAVRRHACGDMHTAHHGVQRGNTNSAT